MARCVVVASLPSGDINSPIPQPNADTPKPPAQPPNTGRAGRRTRQLRHRTKLQQQLTIIHIERAIGAGSYRDGEVKERKKDSIFRGLTPNSEGAMESDMEMKLRETGEWLANTTEEKFQANGKRILMFTVQWGLPIYVFLFLVASGVVKLPFNTPFLEDLLM